MAKKKTAEATEENVIPVGQPAPEEQVVVDGTFQDGTEGSRVTAADSTVESKDAE